MSIVALLVELVEKMSLIAAAALVAVLFPPLRKRLLGLGQRRDKAVGLVFGLGLAVWGSLLGLEVLDENINIRAIGILIAAILGGFKAGIFAGLGAGVFCATLVEPNAAPWVIAASVLDGGVAGYLGKRHPQVFQGWRTFPTTLSIQALHIAMVGVGLLILGDAERYLPSWPAHAVKVLVNATGVTLFVQMARLVVGREEAAVALVEAKRAADKAALDSLRQRLEPHFLFNALNTIRATIRKSPTQARDLVADLADLYRYLLAHPEDALLREEVNHASAYLAIERARLGEDRLVVEVDIPKNAEVLRVPALLLQPLVENAVRHGIARYSDGGTVRISAHVDRSVLEIEVTNDVHGAPVPPLERGQGIALETLRERLRRQFGNQASLSLEVSTKGARSIIRLPAPTPSRADADAGRRDAA
ncbi:MAG: histidine kinase [Myxococcales bacterium]|nr:histidine kinase [Myxococcales bacterium]